MTERTRIDGSEILHLENRFARHVVALREQVAQLTANHLGNDLVRSQFLRVPCADVVAVAHDGHFVGDAQNFVHLVADIDD